MAGKVTLEITDGPLKGRAFEFERHDTFIFGREDDCHAQLAENDITASRHHFILEVNPPDARIRDLGSLNGTHVNEVKYGGREAHESPEEAARRQYPEVDIVDGDRIRVGETIIRVSVAAQEICSGCGIDIPDEFKTACRFEAGAYTCPQCLAKEKKGAPPPKPPEPMRCSQCGKDVSNEVGAGRQGDYVCLSCRKKVDANPIAALINMLAAKMGQPLDADKGEFPGYKVITKLGEGGMGAVYLAVRERDGVQVAIKVMLAKIAVRERARKEFQREIDNTMRLGHSNIVRFYEHGSAGSGFFFVLEYCQGGSVADLMEERRRRLSIDEARPIMIESLEGLACAHDSGFVHRDLKPQNILLTAKTGGIAKIADLGLAKNFEQAGLSGMTMTGAMAGTPVFMPKEQVTNFKYVKPPTDVWSIGATFYCMLTGNIPRDVQRGQSPIDAILKGSIVPIRDRDPNVPRKLAKVIDKSLAADPRSRYPDAGAFLKALKKAL